MQDINGYKIIGELRNDKSGYAKWGFAYKNGVEVFIKEFLSPIYPIDEAELSPELLRRKRKICDDFAAEKTEFYNTLNECVTGNIVNILDFFRYRSKFYIVTEKVETSRIDISAVRTFATEQKLLIMKVVLYCISVLHEHGIVHADLKPDNILLKNTGRGIYTAKIIDFDSGFLEKNAPKPEEELEGDMVYLAPETLRFMMGEEVMLDRKIDIYALGMLFHQYFCGRVPGFDTDKYDYLFEAILDDAPIRISDAVPESIRPLIVRMLKKDPAQRPQASQILKYLQNGREAPRISTKASEINSSAINSPSPTPERKPGSGGAEGFFRKAGDLL